MIFKKEIEALINRFIPKLQFVMKLIGIAERIASPVEVILFILAAVLGAYTGFLLSALISYPMLNNPVLPALFFSLWHIIWYCCNLLNYLNCRKTKR